MVLIMAGIIKEPEQHGKINTIARLSLVLQRHVGSSVALEVTVFAGGERRLPLKFYFLGGR